MRIHKLLLLSLVIVAACSEKRSLESAAKSSSPQQTKVAVEKSAQKEVVNSADEQESADQEVEVQLPMGKPESLPAELTPETSGDKKVPLEQDPLYKLCIDPGPLPTRDPNVLSCAQNSSSGIPLNKWAMDCTGMLPWRYCQCVEFSPGNANWGNCRNEAPSAIPVKDIFPVK